MLPPHRKTASDWIFCTSASIRTTPLGASAGKSTPGSLLSRTAICTSATPSPSASTSALAQEYGGLCNLRFDDTNPVKEDTEYVDSIREDVHWLGGEWDDRRILRFQLLRSIVRVRRAAHPRRQGLCGRPERRARSATYRGTLTQPGTESPCREPSASRKTSICSTGCARGEFADGEHVLRAKIDMASPNVVMRDPTLYRIRHAEHHRTGDKWCIYPMYDFTHCLSDSLEGITHSICTLEFDNNRELYDWVLDALDVYHPAADRVRPPEPDLHGAVQAQAHPAREGRVTCAAGTIPVCPPLAGCAAGDTPRKPSVTSARASAWPARENPWLNTACSSSACAST